MNAPMPTLTSDIEAQWPAIRKLFWSALLSSVHYAIASIDEHGDPHVSPIGSVILGTPGKGIFFERFTSKLPKNLARNSKVSILAVNSGRVFWLKSLFTGTFATSPAVRLHATVGALRPATAEEIELWQRRVRISRFTKGYKLIWADMTMVREFTVDRIDNMRIGAMTRTLEARGFT